MARSDSTSKPANEGTSKPAAVLSAEDRAVNVPGSLFCAAACLAAIAKRLDQVAYLLRLGAPLKVLPIAKLPQAARLLIEEFSADLRKTAETIQELGRIVQAREGGAR